MRYALLFVLLLTGCAGVRRESKPAVVSREFRVAYKPLCGVLGVVEVQTSEFYFWK